MGGWPPVLRFFLFFAWGPRIEIGGRVPFALAARPPRIGLVWNPRLHLGLGLGGFRSLLVLNWGAFSRGGLGPGESPELATGAGAIPPNFLPLLPPPGHTGGVELFPLRGCLLQLQIPFFKNPDSGKRGFGRGGPRECPLVLTQKIPPRIFSPVMGDIFPTLSFFPCLASSRKKPILGF